MTLEQAIVEVMEIHQVEREYARWMLEFWTAFGASPEVAKHLVLDDPRSALMAYIETQDDPDAVAYSCLLTQLDVIGKSSLGRTAL